MNSEPTQQKTNVVKKVVTFITTDIWRIRARRLSRQKSFLIQPLRVILLAIRGFDEDKCQLRASALTFYSLLSIVPMVAMAFGVAKGFGFETMLERQLISHLPGQEEVIAHVIEFARSFLEKTKGGLIAGIGVAVLFWTVIKVLGNIENAFNGIWGVKKERSFSRKLSDYLSIMLICPFLLVVSSSATVVIASQVRLIVEKIALLGVLSPVIFALLRALPYCILWALFTFVYIFMPNTKVNFKSGLIGGIVAGTVYQIVQWAYITFQIGVTKYGAIYGSFAALPLFLVWLRLSWVIVLFGAEISFADQNVETYEFEPDCLRVSHAYKRLLGLWITQMCVKNFHEGKEPLSGAALSHELEVPIRLARDILFELTEAGILSEIKADDNKVLAYQPGRDIDSLTIQNVLDTLDRRGINTLPVVETGELKKIADSLREFKNTLEKSPANAALKDI